MVMESAASEDSLPAVSIDGIMKEYAINGIDILKIDIEGAEKEVFAFDYENWLPKTKILIIELHDHMKKGCSKSVFQAISQYDFSFSRLDENLVFVNENYVIHNGK